MPRRWTNADAYSREMSAEHGQTLLSPLKASGNDARALPDERRMDLRTRAIGRESVCVGGTGGEHDTER